MRCWYDTVQTDPKISPQISALSFRTRRGLRLNSRFTKHSFNCTSVPPATAILVSELFVPSTKGNERNELRNENNSPHTRKKEWEKSQRASMPRRERPMGVWGKHGKWGGGTPPGGGSPTPCCPGEPGAPGNGRIKHCSFWPAHSWPRRCIWYAHRPLSYLVTRCSFSCPTFEKNATFVCVWVRVPRVQTRCHLLTKLLGHSLGLNVAFLNRN